MRLFFFDLFNLIFLRNAFFALCFASIIAGIFGVLLMFRRHGYVIGSLSHASVGGIGVVIFFSYFLNLNGLDPLWGAFSVSALYAVILSYFSYKDLEVDSVLGSLWSLGMAIGVVFIYLTPGYQNSLETYLFGNILLITRSDIYILSLFSILSVSFLCLFYHIFLAITFDKEYIRAKGYPFLVVEILFFSLSCFIVIALIKIIGSIMLLTILTFPALIARMLSRNTKLIFFLAICLCFCFLFLGLMTAYFIDIPTSSTAAILASVSFGLLKFFTLLKRYTNLSL